MAANVYENRRAVYVTPFNGAGIKYGFLTNVSSAVGTTCGHIAVPSDYPTGLVFGANAPKPGRASKKRTNGTDSTFYDISKTEALRTDGWSLSLPTIKRAANTDRSKCYYVTINGVKYAWRTPQTTAAKLAGDATALGLQEPTNNDVDLCWGCRYPKPPKASRTNVGSDGVDTISTFIDPSKSDALPAGWSSAGKEKYTGAV